MEKIKVTTQDLRRVEVDGEIIAPGLAVTQAGWTVTHIPSGKAIFSWALLSFDTAKEHALALAALGSWEDSDSDKLLEGLDMKKVMAIIYPDPERPLPHD